MRSSGGPYGTSGARIATPFRRPAAAWIAARSTSGRSVIVVGSSTGLVDRALAVDAVGDPRQRLEPARGDRLAAAKARAVRAVGHTGERGLDEPELLGRLVAQRQVTLL